ncbi:MAG: hypothetical protein R8L58_03575 [Mariprofundaceae bacterium]
MKYIGISALLLCAWSTPAQAVTPAEDIATTILLRGYDCGGKQVSAIKETQDASGNKIIQATCPNGMRYEIKITADGRVKVKPLN